MRYKLGFWLFWVAAIWLLRATGLQAQSPEVAALEARLRTDLARGDWEQAAVHSAHYLATHPRLSEADRAVLLTLQGSAFRMGGQVSTALELQREAYILRLRAHGEGRPELGRSLLNMGNCYIDLQQPEEALRVLTQGYAILKRHFAPRDTQLIPIYTSLGEACRQLRRHAEAGRWLDMAAACAHPGSGQAAFVALHRIGFHNERGEGEQGARLAQAAISEWRGDADQSALLSLHAAHAEALLLCQRLEEAAQADRRVLVLLPAAQNLPPLALGNLYYGLGLRRLRYGDIGGATADLRKALDCHAAFLQEQARTLSALGLAAWYAGQPEEALRLCEEALGVLGETGGGQAAYLRATLWRQIGLLLAEMELAPSGMRFLQKALHNFEQLPETRIERASCLIAMARCARAMGARTVSRERLGGAARLLSAGDAALRAECALLSAGLFLDEKQYAQAEAEAKRVADLPAAEVSAWERTQAYALLADILCRWAQSSASASGRTALWERGLQYASTGATLLKRMKRSLWGESPPLEIQAAFGRLYDAGLSANLAFGDIAEAWAWSERLRNDYLRHLLWRALPSEGFAAHAAPASAAHGRQWPPSPRAVRNIPGAAASDAPQRRMETAPLASESVLHAPKTESLAFEASETTSIPDLQTSLQPDQCLLSYHWGAEGLGLFVLRRDTFIYFALEADPEVLTEDIRAFYRLCSRHPLWQSDGDHAELSRRGQALYEALLAPVAPWLTRDLVVIPSGMLYYLPFEALIIKPSPYAHRFGSHRYVLKEHTVSYAHSAGVWLFLTNKPPSATAGKLLAVAPIFGDNAYDLAPLRHNRDEARRVCALWQGRLLSPCDEGTFVTSAPHYGMILLSTHGLVDYHNFERTFVAFDQPGTPPSDNLLLLPDIYALRLDADLLVLSACETAIGPVYTGGGLVNLSRAFQSAGARSVVAAMWNVDDHRSERIVVEFFKCLHAGLPSSVALAKARREYLASASGKEAHPYYWAGYMVSGAAVTCPPPKQVPCLWIWAGLILLGMLGIWRLYRLRLIGPTNTGGSTQSHYPV